MLTLCLFLIFIFLYVLFQLATFIFFFYQLLLLTIGFLVVSSLIILIRRSRYRLWRYGLEILTGAIILYICFLAIPKFNFVMTFTARQQMVNKFVQENIKIENTWLGETTYSKNSSGVSVYFTYFKGSDRYGSRIFLVYKTTPTFDPRMTVKKLKKNWYLFQGTYAS